MCLPILVKRIYFIVVISLPVFCTAQENLSLSVIEKNAKQFDLHAGLDVFQRIKFIDTAQRQVSFSSFKGKICYVDFWFIGCAPCASEIPYWKKRVSQFASDTNIVFIQVCLLTKGSIAFWKKYVRDNDLPGLQLTYDPANIKKGTSSEIERKMFIEEYPTYSILNKDGRIMGHRVPTPSTQLIIDYILFNAVRGKMPSRSFIEVNQELLNLNTKTTSPEFVSWVESFYSMSFMNALVTYVNGEN